ncbi:MAG: hypothetical protein A3F72_15590 [Bacteroidetes bacterium RIFCSPLOWO2_12_FULL_35_15]|nr:MAG: hypothetical protein A3F72_15590 [Bacteroidetes bacterium RIFCSPLOWO2_12_FULL_35_15]
MKSNNIFTSILLFVCFALYVAIELKLPCKEGEKECGAKTKRLEVVNDSLRKNNKALEKKYQELELKADSLQETLSITKKTIVQLKNKQHEKVNAIDALTNDELFGFFSKFNTESTGTK